MSLRVAGLQCFNTTHPRLEPLLLLNFFNLLPIWQALQLPSLWIQRTTLRPCGGISMPWSVSQSQAAIRSHSCEGPLTILVWPMRIPPPAARMQYSAEALQLRAMLTTHNARRASMHAVC
mmetsp:Transcript_19998/g.60758  ORF Transcript_19998/g.60758 Transcript_19998/m.60758 type:complete len:120 (-) Transcript_19998:491-850(-)